MEWLRSSTRASTVRPAARSEPHLASIGQIGRLQSTVGNQAVAALLGARSGGVQRLPVDRSTGRSGGGLMRIGSRGPAVRAVQGRLGITADGVFGPQTRVAVGSFQRRAGLSADGIVGPATRAALDGSASRRPGSPGQQPGQATAALIAQRLAAITARLHELASDPAAQQTAPAEQVEQSPTTEVVDETAARDDWLDDAGDWYDETVDEVSDAAGEAWDETTDFIDETVDEVSDAAGEAWDETTDFIDETVDEVSDAAGEAWDETTDFIDETVDEVSDAAGDAWDETTDFIDETVDEVSDAAGDAWDTAGDIADAVVDQLAEVADDVFDSIDELADSVRELVADPIGQLGEIVDDLLGSGPSGDILRRLTEVWNGLFGGDEDEAQTDASGTIDAIGPSAVAHACPRGDDLSSGRPMRVNVQLDWGPPSIDGPSSDVAESRLARDDRVQASVTYRGFISQTLPAANIPGFGREEPSLTVESIHWDQSDGVVEVRAYARLDCRWGINAHGRIDIPNADVPAVDEITWSHVIDDLTPGSDDKPPRLMYWASDATSSHEYYHAIDDYGAGESMVGGGDAVSTVNNRQIVDPEAELPAIMQEIHARIYQHLQDHYRSGGESRAYAATAPIFHERVAAIRARAEREGWT